VERFHELVEWWCLQSTMDPWTESGQSSPERSPCSATGHQSSPWRRGEGEGDGAELTEAKIGRRGGEVAPVAERIEVRRRCSVWASEGTEKRNKEWHELWCGAVMR
jgi:hypothetical protein